MFENYFIYYLLGLIAVIIAVSAEVRVQSAYNKYNEVVSKKGITGAKFARDILDLAGLNDIDVIQVKGTLSEHYDYKRKVIGLSESTYNSSSVASLGITAHEIGHALQYKEGYKLIKIRNFLVPVINFTSNSLLPIIIVGIIISATIGANLISDIFVIGGVAFYVLMLILNLATLPIEYDASSRAKKLLISTGALEQDEMEGVNNVLGAAALTYVAAIVTSVIYLLRFILIFTRRD